MEKVAQGDSSGAGDTTRTNGRGVNAAPVIWPRTDGLEVVDGARPHDSSAPCKQPAVKTVTQITRVEDTITAAGENARQRNEGQKNGRAVRPLSLAADDNPNADSRSFTTSEGTTSDGTESEDNQHGQNLQPQSPRTPLLENMTQKFVMRAANRRLSQDYDRHVLADDNEQQSFRAEHLSSAGDADSGMRRNYSGRKQSGSENEIETPRKVVDSSQFFAHAAQRRLSNDFDRHSVANDNNQKSFSNAFSPKEAQESDMRRRSSVSEGDIARFQQQNQQPPQQQQRRQPRYVQQLSRKSEEGSFPNSARGSSAGEEYEQTDNQPVGVHPQNFANEAFYSKPQRQGSSGSRRSRDRERSDSALGTNWFGGKPLYDQNLEELIWTALRVLLLLTCLFVSVKIVGALGRFAWHSYHPSPTVSRLQRGIQVEKGEYCRSFDTKPHYGVPMAMKEMLNDARWSDVIVQANDGTQVKAHKVVLAARSPVLRDKLEELSQHTDSDGRAACSVDRPCKLKLLPVDSGILPSFIEFLYTSRTNDRKHAAELLALGHTFQVPDLKDAAAEDLMLNMNDKDSVGGLIAGHDYDHSGLRNFSMEYIRENWKQVRESASWKEALEHRPSLIIDALMYVITESKCRW